MGNKEVGSRSLGTFSGVFVPTFLSIIGVILFLRLGFIIGNVGILGTILIILLAVSVTLCTGLALSSITSNINIGSGGAYSIISKTLGLEIGGSVGIPLFLAQTFSVALYIFGFSEIVNFLYPQSNFLLISLSALAVLFAITYISTKIAVKAQIVVFVVTLFSLASIFLGGSGLNQNFSTPLVVASSQFPFWAVFALFFPAVTGLMAGIGMSGELSDPKKQIPKGVIYSLGITTIIYILVALFIAYYSNPSELLTNNLILVKLSFFAPLVIFGILASTFSSALTNLVAAPRVLQALGSNSIVPFSKVLAKKTNKGEPRNSVAIVFCILFLLMFITSLNSIAQALTIFFLITYMMINISVFIEQTLGLASFRPTFKIPKFIPLYGTITSLAIMFLISPAICIFSLILVFILYFLLVNKNLKQEKGDVRSGLFREISEWSAKKVLNLKEKSQHIWKPNILVPVITTSTLFGNFPLIKNIAKPHGTMTVLGFKLMKNIRKNPESKTITEKKMETELSELPELVEKFSKTGIFTSFSTVEVDDYTNGIITALEAIESQVFSPNILFLPFRPDKVSHFSLERIIDVAKKEKVGLVIFDRDPESELGSEEDIHIWISPKDMKKKFYEDKSFDLGMLIGYDLKRNWNGKIHLWMCVPKKKEQEAKTYLKRLIYESRIPTAEINVKVGDFMRHLKEAPDGDIHIIPFEKDLKKVLEITKEKNKSFLFVSDSTKEDILA